MFAGLHHSPRLGVTLALLLLLLPSLAAAQNQPGPSSATPQHVVCDSGCGSPPATPDTASFLAGTTNVSITAAVFDDALTGLVAGKSGATRMTSFRALHFNLRDAGGTEIQFPAALSGGGFKVACISGCAGGALGQATMANSSPVVIASDQSAVAVTATLAAETTKVIGTVNQGTSPWTVNLITGFALAATQTDRSQKTQLTDGTRDGTVKAASTLPLLTDTAVVTTQRDPLPAGTNAIGKLASNSGVDIGDVDVLTLPSVTIGVFPDNEPFNLAQVGGTSTVTGGVAGLLAVSGNIAHDSPDAGNPIKIGCKAETTAPVAVADNDRVDLWCDEFGRPIVRTVFNQTGTDNDVDIVTFPDNEPFNLAQYGGTAVVTGGVAGLLGVGGNVAHDGIDSGNPVKIGCRSITATPTAVAIADRTDCLADVAGNIYITDPVKWTCALEGIAATLTQCQAAPAAGYSLYLTVVTFASTTGTAGTAAIRSGTGSNCGTTTTGVLPGATTSRTYNTPINTAQPFVWSFPVGLKLTAAHALCAIGVATNTLNITMAGYTAP